MAIKDVLSVNRHVFMTSHNDGCCGVWQALVELPMPRWKRARVDASHAQYFSWESIFVLKYESSGAFGL
jgi:hypothetical protein